MKLPKVDKNRIERFNKKPNIPFDNNASIEFVMVWGISLVIVNIIAVILILKSC